ncbi:hypothetical protein MXM51_21295 [Pantoea stewartii]|uniref:DUF4209 domain-containing protein n=1 Tax=Pantoea stewartii TaxID=66269 RepID=UPI002DBA378F|nr:DUF4209 domain-containing protein [Pantoea stewartii]MEB6537057.1 hypothetical protein [Pantoea stewartii]
MPKFKEQEGEDMNMFKDYASTEDLRAVSLDSILSDYQHIDDTGMAYELSRAAEEALKEGNISAHRGLSILKALCTFHMNSNDPADTWHPRFTDGNVRTLTPADVRGKQNSALAEIIGEISHPGLRARVADVVWTNDRKQHQAASEAVKAYCQWASGAISGTYKCKRKGEIACLSELCNFIQRALYINALTGKKKSIPDTLKDAFLMIYHHARKKHHYVLFARLGELATGYKLLSWQDVALDSEQLVKEGNVNDYPEARKKTWLLAARCYEKLNDNKARRRCLSHSVDETLKMRDQVSSFAAKAAWLRQAISELRIAGGFNERVKSLIEEMRITQLSSLDELSEYSIPLDLTEERKQSTEKFSKLLLPEVLFHFAVITQSLPLDFLKDAAYKHRQKGLMAILAPKSLYFDREGKVRAESSGKITSEGPDDNWFKENSLVLLDTMRHHIVEGVINPARCAVMQQYPLETRHFDAITSLSPFVPFGHEHIFSLGFARFWQGDFASAVFLLIPQLENSLRHILMNAGRDTFKSEKGEIQEDRSLSALIEQKRDDLETILGEETVYEIDLLFHFKAGPSLRHKLAHGKLTSGDCYSAECIYACWFIYRLTCIPLLPYWEKKVSPQILQYL